jgi:hypothetical protein
MKTHLLTLALLTVPSAALADMSADEVQELLVEIDERQRTPGDYKALALIEQKRGGEADAVYQSAIYRRDAEDRFMILFVKPRSEAGKGYLRLDQNMFMYDPTVGKWERRTERERLMGTDTRRADLDEWRLSEQYEGTFVADEKLGRFDVHHLELTAKDGARVPYPKMHIWVDAASHNVLKRQDFALSGRLMRTAYYPRWKKLVSPSGDAVHYPEEMRIFDEVEEGNRTTVVITQLDLRALDPNIFTKAWLESRSR